MVRRFLALISVGSLLLLVLTGCVHLPQPAFRGTPLAPAATGSGPVRVLVRFNATPGPDEISLIKGLGGEVRHVYTLIPTVAATLPGAAVDALSRNPKVARVVPDGRMWALDVELDNTWGVVRIGADLVHASGDLGAGIKVAILDTGIDYTHPDLDANYYGGYDFVNDDPDPMDDHGHGTHVAGTVAAEDNGVGVVGVAPAAELYALKVLDADGSGYWSDLIAALDWCVRNGIQVVNMSLGGTGNDELEAACQAAYDAGVLLVAAAGNSGNPAGRGDNISDPAAYPSVIAVAAVDRDDTRASWSSTGPDLELSAPGVNINSTLLGGGYGEMSGTSMASPHVAGTAALVWAAYPGLSNVELRHILRDTADDLGDAGWDPQYGFGLVDADEAAGVTAGTAGTLYVESIEVVLSYRGPFVWASATVTVVDTDGSPVEGASVVGQWGGVVTGEASGITDADGRVTFVSDRVRSPGSGSEFSFCVTDITKDSYVYDPSLNLETCDGATVP
ncbi:MAG: S8 family peptidase [Caldiserica bacterium]|nr:S8 family peptidase [Caldisericota bacterium]